MVVLAPVLVLVRVLVGKSPQARGTGETLESKEQHAAINARNIPIHRRSIGDEAKGSKAFVLSLLLLVVATVLATITLSL
mmetsp:Transcript_13714/g.28746  ORF Transcript_13714/g.28746 Transcript_13714/m.28746 type:complete len:80 (-) Transcript_13714:136-375(-)